MMRPAICGNMLAVIEIRQGRPEDDVALRRVDTATWTAEVSPAPAPSAAAAFFNAGTDPGDVLVGIVGGSVCGYAKLGQPIALPSHRHVMELSGLAVAPAQQRLGVGRCLVEAAVEEARGRGARKLSLRVLGPNIRARGLYETCGFVVEGLLSSEFLLDDRYVDDVLMARNLVITP